MYLFTTIILQTLYKTQVKEQKEEIEDAQHQIEELEADLQKLKNERDSITSTLQLALTKADSQQLLRKIAEDSVSSESLSTLSLVGSESLSTLSLEGTISV